MTMKYSRLKVVFCKNCAFSAILGDTVSYGKKYWLCEIECFIYSNKLDILEIPDDVYIYVNGA